MADIKPVQQPSEGSAAEKPLPTLLSELGANDVLLLVDDNEDDVLLATVAAQKSYPTLLVKTVQNGQEAICYLAGQGIYADRQLYPLPSLVLLDVRMPQKSGFEVLDWIRQHSTLPSCIVVMFSGSHIPADLLAASVKGANSYLLKPTLYAEWVRLLQTTVYYWLKLHQAPPR